MKKFRDTLIETEGIWVEYESRLDLNVMDSGQRSGQSIYLKEQEYLVVI
jgi:hypothetical protein